MNKSRNSGIKNSLASFALRYRCCRREANRCRRRQIVFVAVVRHGDRDATIFSNYVINLNAVAALSLCTTRSSPCLCALNHHQFTTVLWTHHSRWEDRNNYACQEILLSYCMCVYDRTQASYGVNIYRSSSVEFSEVMTNARLQPFPSQFVQAPRSFHSWRTCL